VRTVDDLLVCGMTVKPRHTMIASEHRQERWIGDMCETSSRYG
jgi:hypothetical protein